MALEPVAADPGLWREPGWVPNAPGLYALIIGISQYDHLEGGPAPAPDTFGLGQLHVSASTACAVFDWLRTDYRCEGVRPVWCRLLLAPTVAEAAELDRRGVKHYGRPDYATIVRALASWTGSLPSQDAAAAASRSFIFFSGHGVQAAFHPLLLPSDYLDPTYNRPRLQDCVSTREIRAWMETCGAGAHLAIYDACRNEFAPLTAKGVTAHGAIEAVETGGQPPGVVATFWATAPNGMAYQPAEASGALTFFGGALIEGLKGASVAPLSGLTPPYPVDFNGLVGYVRRRVLSQLRAVNEQLQQNVHSALEPSDTPFVVALTDTATALANSLGWNLNHSDPGGVRGLAPVSHLVGRQPDLDTHPFEQYPPAPEAIAELLRPPFFRLKPMLPYESVSDVSVADVRLVSEGAQDGQILTARARMTLPPSRGGVLAVFEHETRVARASVAIPLPTDPRVRVPIELTLTLRRGEQGQAPTLLMVTAALGSSDDAAYLFLSNLGRRLTLGGAIDAYFSGRQAAGFQELDLLRKVASRPTVCVALTLQLIRAGKLDKVARQFPLLTALRVVPDSNVDVTILRAVVLHLRLLKEEDESKVREDLRQAIEALGSRLLDGVPIFSESIYLADELATALSRRPELSEEQRETLRRVEARLDRIMQHSTPADQFVAYAGDAWATCYGAAEPAP